MIGFFTKRGEDDRRQRGAVLVEAALAFPILFLVVAGIIDFSFQFKASLTLANAARAGVRTASIDTRQSGYLQATFQAAVNGLNELSLTDTKGASIWIYKADISTGYPVNSTGDKDFSGCTYCAVLTYNAGTFSDPASWTCTSGCQAGQSPGVFLPTGWAASGTSSSQYACTTPPGSGFTPATGTDATNDSLGGPDAVGVYIHIDHFNLTNYFPPNHIALTDHAVARLEPAFASSGCFN